MPHPAEPRPTLVGYVTQTPSGVPGSLGSAPELRRWSQCSIAGDSTYIGIADENDGRRIAVVMGAQLMAPGRASNATLVTRAKQLLSDYSTKGAAAFADLRNDFAAALFDLEKQTAYIAVDRVGRCALAYAVLANGDFCFSSDARAVARLSSSQPELNPQAIYDYAFFHAIPSGETVFAGVKKVLPAGCVQWRGGKVDVSTYWIPDFASHTNRSLDDLGAEFLQLLEKGVANCEPQQSTASFLSGGIDSSTVTGMLAKLQGRGRPAYTIGFEQAGYDETEYARIAAKHFGAELRVHYITTQQVQDCIPELGSLYDEPFGNSSAAPALVCSRIARQDGIDQLLAGDGGDELFAGNTRYAKQRIFEVYPAIPGFLRSMLEGVFLGESNPLNKTPLRKIGSYISQARIPLPERMESYNYLLRETQVQIFEPEFLKHVDTKHPFALQRDRYWQPKNTSTLDRMLYLDWKFTLADNDLRKVSATCRQAGVGVAFPWLDDAVIEFCTRVPPQMKMRGTKLRYFVKHALGEFLPRETITKSKHGFGLPFGQWLKTSPALQTQVYDLLSGLGKRGMFREDFIKHLIAEHQGGHASYYGTMVWVLAMLEAWLQANHTRR